jgi:hypothetical protein
MFDIDEAEEGVKDLKIERDVQEPAEHEILEKDEALEDEDSKKDDGISFSNQRGPAWAGSERDYTYEELLNRVFNIMRKRIQMWLLERKVSFLRNLHRSSEWNQETFICELYRYL